MNCRGENTREQIAKDYIIKPIAHLKLLAGQEKKSCTGDALTDSYYCFSYQNKKNSNNTGTFVCGSHAAEHFMALIGAPRLSIFDPLKSATTGMPVLGGTAPVPGSTSVRGWDNTAKQLHNAICLILVYWCGDVKGPLAIIKDEIENTPHLVPSLARIKAVNTIISKDKSPASTLQDMVAFLGQKNNVKTFDFALLNNMLAQNNIPSNFG